MQLPAGSAAAVIRGQSSPLRISVRAAVESDFAVVASRMLDIDPPDYIKQPAFNSWCGDSACRLLVAELDEKGEGEGVVGVVLLHLGVKQLGEGAAYIGALRVSREHRRRRIGVGLIRAAYQLARELNPSGSIKMKVHATNDNMKLLLAKHLTEWEGLTVCDSATGHRLSTLPPCPSTTRDGDALPELVREVTRYTTRNGLGVAVEGYSWESDEHGGNLAAHGKHTGEAFWHVSRMLADYLCWDCPALQSQVAAGAGRRVVDLGCGLGLAGLVAATLLDETGRVDLTDGDVDVVSRANLSAAANSAATRPATVESSVLRWGDESAIATLNHNARAEGGAACASPAGLAYERKHSGAGAYDLVLASDCIYENGSDPSIAVGMARMLAKTAAALLKREPLESLPLRGQTPPEEWHAWIDMADHVGEDANDEYVWPPRPSRQAQARDTAAAASSSQADSSPADFRPMCVVGFARRNVPLSVILDGFEAEGFEHHIPHAGHQDDPEAGEGCVCLPPELTACKSTLTQSCAFYIRELISCARLAARPLLPLHCIVTWRTSFKTELRGAPNFGNQLCCASLERGPADRGGMMS